ncbi:MAG: transketolase family protein [Candidatus Portnoybacteria bacterium]|nr:transketolase family protein [Candidatus Portnoybacteria bacterium]
MNNIKKSTRDGYGQALVKIGKENKDILVLCADLTNSTRTEEFKKKFPKRFIQTGIAEQNMMGLAAGMALTGKIPFVSSFAVFSPGINWSQLRVSVCQNNANVKIASTHAGLTVGPDGMSHQALEDIAMTRPLPNLIILSPCDAIEAEKATITAVNHKGPVYIRLTRPKTNIITKQETEFTIGKANILKQGKDITIIGHGPILNNCIQAAENLKKQNIDAEIINSHTIKPLDKETIINSAKKTSRVITVEDHQKIGGLGSAVAELLSQDYPVKIKIIGVDDKFGESGQPEELMKKYNIGTESIIQAVNEILK